MSSMNEGNDDGAREDELDLGQEDADLPARANGHPANHLATDDVEEPESAQDGDLPTILADADETKSQEDIIGEASSQLLARVVQSTEETSSLPDDTPSLHGSLRSSPSSSAFLLRESSTSSPVPAHRPFDLRFQSRLSSSSFSSPRLSSPFVFNSHSRNSSFASQPWSGAADVENEPPQAPWEVVRWTKLRKIGGQSFSEIGRRNFGQPTCISISTTIVLGTSKGVVLVFDYQQNLKIIIGPGTKAVEAGAVTSIAVSADHSTVAAGHASGEIFTWEISRAARPFLHIPPIQLRQREDLGVDGHIAGASVLHLGFLGTRRTALVSADDRGMAFSHLATRGMGAVGRTVKTTRILGRYPDSSLQNSRPRKPSSVLAFSPLPLGNVDQPTDRLGLVAMLTPYLLVIVSTTPVAQTQYKSPRPKEIGTHNVMSAALAWFPAIRLKGKDDISQTKLVYCWSNVLTVLEVLESESDGGSTKDRPPVLEFRPRSRWRANEAIVAVQWLSRSVMAVLTITQQLLILEDKTLRVTDSFDLLHKHIYHSDLFSSQLHSLVEQYDENDTSMHGVVADAFSHSLKAYKGRLFLLGYNDLSVGSLSNWADRLLAYMEIGDFVAAIRLATSYYQGDAEKLTVGLPEEDDLRHSVVGEKLLEMISASLRFAFGRNQEASAERAQNSQLEELAEASITACTCIEDYDYLWDELYDWYEEHDAEGIFLDVLEKFIREGQVKTIPPTAFKALINYYSAHHTSSWLEEVICLLDPTTMDIEQVTILCKQHNLYDAFIYVWNCVLRDYISPLETLLEFAIGVMRLNANGNTEAYVGTSDYNNAMKMFPYFSFIFTGRIYPTGEEMSEDVATISKTLLYTYLFSGGVFSSPNHKNSLSALQVILKFDSSSFMSMLNEAFEDSFLNHSSDLADADRVQASTSQRLTMNRQYIISILLDVMDSPDYGPLETIYLDMFIARNLPKYPQYILLSGTTLHQVLERLCQCPSEEMADDCELSVEYLLSVYHPHDIQGLIPLLQKAQFFRVLKSTYRAEKQFPDLILTYLQDTSERDLVFKCIRDCLRSGSGLSNKQQREVIQVIKNNAGQLALINVSEAARTIHEVLPSLHTTFLDSLKGDDYKQFHYLATLLEPENYNQKAKVAPAELNSPMVEQYVNLLCKYNRSHVVEYIEALRVNELRLETVLPSMETSGVVDGAVVLLARQGQLRRAMDRLLAYLGTLESGLVGILRSADEAPDSAGTAEAVRDFLDSIEKYSGIGIWLCQGQTKTSKPSQNGIARNGKRVSITLQQPLTFEEELWLDLIDAVVRISRSTSSLLYKASLPEDSKWTLGDEKDSTEIGIAFRQLIQRVFTALLSCTTTVGGPPSSASTEVSFLRVLRAFLSRAASSSPSLSELRTVLASVFSTYTYEESLLSLANGMLDKDLFVHVDEVTKLRQRGWRPRGQVCEICRNRIWGPGAGASIWAAWERKRAVVDKERARKALEDDSPLVKGKEPSKVEEEVNLTVSSSNTIDEGDDELSDDRALSSHKAQSHTGPVVVFACRHLCHRGCLLDRKAGENGSGHLTSSLKHDANWGLACPICT
ncbi:putative Golgi complex component [Talaromyces proteolyticus]|uniref:Golgi complex component n=1 Tax=Talaromyces proteolyticus TaxID=1131652 RepID=A0AAD4KV94_9EURO|nr:putative Golgi complex component [Talaromyces proteolyticus]KAH8700615.1 putative Golgi complex component [Talaromyces proteolyticus]